MEIQETADSSKLQNNWSESVYKLFKETHKQKSATKKFPHVIIPTLMQITHTKKKYLSLLRKKRFRSKNWRSKIVSPSKNVSHPKKVFHPKNNSPLKKVSPPKKLFHPEKWVFPEHCVFIKKNVSPEKCVSQKKGFPEKFD